MFFYLNEIKQRNPYYNLAKEEAIAINMKEYNIKAGLRFWRNPNSIVLGISDSLSHNVNEKILNEWLNSFENLNLKKKFFSNLIYIARRASGGGTVLQTFDENLNFSFFVDRNLKPELNSVVHSYQIFLGLVQKALEKQQIFVKLKGHSDLSFQEKENFFKVSGNSQFRKKDIIVHHGTFILQESLIQKIETSLLHPPKEPEYRQKRKHTEFLKNLPPNFNIKKFQEDLKKIFLDYLQIFPSKPSQDFWREVAKNLKVLQKTKYQNKDFIFSKP